MNHTNESNDKKGFILYNDLLHSLNLLPDDDAGRLFKHILQYVNGDTTQTDSLLIKIAFEPIKQHIIRDTEKWEIRAENSRKNGAKGGRPKKTEQEKQKLEKTQKTQQVNSKPKKPVNVNAIVNDNVIVNDNDNVIVNDNYRKRLLSEINISDVPNQIYFEITLSFWELFKNNLIEKDISTITIDKAKGTWIDDIRKLMEIDGKTKSEITEVFEFLQEDEFWKPIIQSTRRLRENFDKLLMQSRSNGKKNNETNKGTSQESIAKIVAEQFGNN